ncbi:hypothetical protein [Sinorhizobium fredii]|uniref:hypothetical protein n=1 Tax=Rhizobium fredii TaxID=380 RepID=UPI0012FDCE50|nr:hypothetical protein [Sinorhizobium fredii]
MSYSKLRKEFTNRSFASTENTETGIGDYLRADYALLQGHYEAFDARAFDNQSWAVPLLSAGLGVGIKESSLGLLFSTALASMCLWSLEAS